MSSVYLKQKMNTLESIPYEQLKKPSNIPVAIYLREAKGLIEVARKDLAALEAVGYERGMLDELAIRAGALREAESQWRLLRHTGSEDLRRWNKAEIQADRLFTELRLSLTFALRHDKAAVKIVREVTKGRGAAALIQGLNNLFLIAGEKREALQAIGFDMAVIDEGEGTMKRLAALLGAADCERHRESYAMRLRDAAYTHLYEGLKELRGYGLYINRENREQALRYTSDYLRKKRINRRKKKEQNGTSCRKERAKRADNSLRSGGERLNGSGRPMKRLAGGMTGAIMRRNCLDYGRGGSRERTNSFVNSMKAFRKAINCRK